MLSDQQQLLSMTLRALEEIFWKTYPLGEDDIVLLYWYRAWYSDRLIKWSEIIKSARENNSWQNLLSYNATADEYNGQWHWNSNLLWNYHNQLNYFTMVQVHVSSRDTNYNTHSAVDNDIHYRNGTAWYDFPKNVRAPICLQEQSKCWVFACNNQIRCLLSSDFLFLQNAIRKSGLHRKFSVSHAHVSGKCLPREVSQMSATSSARLTFADFGQTLKTTAYITLSKSTINTPYQSIHKGSN